MTRSTALQVFVPVTPRERAAALAALASGDRRRHAAAAAAAHDAGELETLQLAYLLTKSRQHERVSDHTVRAYGAGARSLVAAWQGENLLHPSPDAGDRYVAALSRDLAPASVEARLAGASALYRALRWSRATDADPFRDVKAPVNRTPRHERRRPYADAALQALLDDADPRLRLLLLLCAHGGLRIAEACALQWADVRLASGWMLVRAGKGGKSRTVHLSATLAAELARAAGGGAAGPVVRRRDGEAAHDTSWLRRRLDALCRRAGVEYLGFHALRHTAGTRLARETGNLQLVAAHLGHADVSTTAIYAKWSDDQLAHAVAEW